MTLLAAAARPGLAKPVVSDPGDADFAADVYGRVATGQAGNVFVSPFSLRTALAMTATGAAGDTAAQMAAALRVPADRLAAFVPAVPAGDGCEADVANGIWAAAGVPFRPPFVQHLQADFNAAVRTADFANAAEPTRREINTWVADRTHGKVADLLPPNSLTAGTGLVLVNAVYFKASWSEPFQPRATYDGTFHLDPTHDVPARMMTQGATTWPVCEAPTAMIAELPYQGGRLSMVIVVPKAVDGLPAIERGLTGDILRGWMAKLQPTRAYLLLPRFTATGSYKLAPVLTSLGMSAAFDPNRADFSGIVDPATDPRRLFISQVFHKTFVAVDEQGTEAAAASAVNMGVTAAAPEQLPTVMADRPFLYLIRDRQTNGVLFIGRCADPRP